MRHFALPPALTNSSSGVATGSISSCGECGVQLVATGVSDDAPADDDSIAGKAFGFCLFDLDQFLDVFADCALAVVVERGWVPDRFSISEGAEAGVEVIVAGIDKFDRYHAATEHAANLLVTGGVASHAVASIERIATEERIAGSFEAEVSWDIDDFKTIFSQPASVVRLFALPLTMAETREKRLLPVDHRGVGREYEVGQTVTRAPNTTHANQHHKYADGATAIVQLRLRARLAATCPSTD